MAANSTECNNKISCCLVCGSSAGKHNYYGARTCISCRGFFRRRYFMNIIKKHEFIFILIIFIAFKVNSIICLFVQRTQRVTWNRNRENVAKNVDLKNA